MNIWDFRVGICPKCTSFMVYDVNKIATCPQCGFQHKPTKDNGEHMNEDYIIDVTPLRGRYLVVPDRRTKAGFYPVRCTSIAIEGWIFTIAIDHRDKKIYIDDSAAPACSYNPAWDWKM